jgi:hypothetical protein
MVLRPSYAKHTNSPYTIVSELCTMHITKTKTNKQNQPLRAVLRKTLGVAGTEVETKLT